MGTSDGVKVKIAALNDQINDCLEANDLQCLLKLYDDDVRLMHENHPTTIGKTGLASHMEWMKNVATTIVHSEEIAPLDPKADFVFERSVSTVIGKNGKTYSGKNLTIWKRYGSSYKLYIQMYNKGLDDEVHLTY